MENNIKIRKEYDIFETDERTFKLMAFDPMEGNYMLMQIISFVMPLGIGSMLSSKIGTESIPTDLSQGKMMSKNDFVSLEKDILCKVEEVFRSGVTSPVVRENGTYGVENLSMALIARLIVASLAFNFKDFFEDIPFLKDVLLDQDSNPADTKI